MVLLQVDDEKNKIEDNKKDKTNSERTNILIGIVIFFVCVETLIAKLPQPRDSIFITTVSVYSMLPYLKNNETLTVNTNFTDQYQKKIY